MLPQYSDKTLKSKSVTRLDKISNTIKGEVFYTTGWTMPELLFTFAQGYSECYGHSYLQNLRCLVAYKFDIYV